jgi:hypothetical protein
MESIWRRGGVELVVAWKELLQQDFLFFWFFSLMWMLMWLMDVSRKFQGVGHGSLLAVWCCVGSCNLVSILGPDSGVGLCVGMPHGC